MGLFLSGRIEFYVLGCGLISYWFFVADVCIVLISNCEKVSFIGV